MAHENEPSVRADLKEPRPGEDAKRMRSLSPAAPDFAKGQTGNSNGNLSVPRRSHSPDSLSLLSTDDHMELHLYDAHRVASSTHSDVDPSDEKHQPTWKSRLARSWVRNKGLVLVLTAQVFANMMSVSTRILEQDSGQVKPMTPMNIMFIRMAVTTVICVSYCWYTSVEHFPLGAREVRWQLVGRGFGGFFGVFGFYYSLIHLSLSDAVTLSFLAPSLICYACSKILNEPFTRAEKIGGLIALSGVVLIARPSFIFSAFAKHSDVQHIIPANATMYAARAALNADSTSTTTTPHKAHATTPRQRLVGIAMAMLSVLGTTIAFTMIRWIGRRAHPLISTNYFSVCSLIISVFALLVIPGWSFELPEAAWQWALLLLLGVCGFLNQFLMTAGLRYAKDSRATNMTFSSMVFALISDKIVWGHSPSALSLVGSALIVGSALLVALQKERGKGSDRSGAVDLEAGPAATDAAETRIASERLERGTTEEQAGLLHELGAADGDVELEDRAPPQYDDHGPGQRDG